MYEEEFSKRLTELRMHKGVSARDMSLSLGQNPGYINHIENKQIFPSLPVFLNICEYLDITPQQFFDTENANPSLIDKIVDDLKKMNNEQLSHLAFLVHDMKKK